MVGKGHLQNLLSSHILPSLLVRALYSGTCISFILLLDHTVNLYILSILILGRVHERSPLRPIENLSILSLDLLRNLLRSVHLYIRINFRNGGLFCVKVRLVVLELLVLVPEVVMR